MIFLFLVSLSFLFPQEELVDGVLAVVGNKNILFSEVLSESRMKADRKGVSPQSSPLLFQNIFDSVLKEKIYLNVVLISAEKDSLISVSYDEIKNNLDERIDLFSTIIRPAYRKPLNLAPNSLRPLIVGLIIFLIIFSSNSLLINLDGE